MEGETSPPASYNSVMATPPSSCCSFEDPGDGSTLGSGGNYSAGDRIEMRRNRILFELHQAANRYDDCILRLEEAMAEVKLLRVENLQLTAENLELAFLFEKADAAAAEAAGAQASLDYFSADSYSASPIPICIRSSMAEGGDLASAEDPASDDTEKGTEVEPRGVVPKSISIRSPEFTVLTSSSSSGGSRSSTVLQVDEEKGAGEVEVEVYTQGTLKTELCNKWVEKGWCPYGDRCQFAHGMQELRPVIRHPRYKTQLCRMVDADGGGCPYGHRCHFRHAVLPDPAAT